MDLRPGSTVGGYPIIAGVTTDGYLPKFAGGVYVNSSLYEDTSGRVGIGIFNLTERFAVGGNSIFNGGVALGTTSTYKRTGVSASLTGGNGSTSDNYSIAFGLYNTALSGNDNRIVKIIGVQNSSTITVTDSTGFTNGSYVYIYRDGLSLISAKIASIAGTTVTLTEVQSTTNTNTWTYLVRSGATATGTSVALGSNTLATGLASLATGQRTIVTGLASSSSGYKTYVSGDYSTANGYGISVISPNSFASGYESIVAASGGYIEGYHNIAATLSLGSNYIYKIINTDSATRTITLNNVTNITTGSDVIIRSETGKPLYDKVKTVDAGTNTIVLTSELPTNIYTQLIVVSPSTFGGFVHVEGYNNFAAGTGTHIEGSYNTGYGDSIHVEGYRGFATGSYSHVEGNTNTAIGNSLHAEGSRNSAIASSSVSRITGYDTESKTLTLESGLLEVGTGDTVYIFKSTAELVDDVVANISTDKKTVTLLNTTPDNLYEYILSSSTSSEALHVEGTGNLVVGNAAHGEGYYNKAIGACSHSEGYYNQTLGNSSHSEGRNNIVIGIAAHVEGGSNVVNGSYSHGEGYYNYAYGAYTHAEGGFTGAMSNYAHAEGRQTLAAHALLVANIVSVNGPNKTITLDTINNLSIGDEIVIHVDTGRPVVDIIANISGNTVTVTNLSPDTSWKLVLKIVADPAPTHAEGYYSIATGHSSHAEGYQTFAIGNYSHAQGVLTTAFGTGSHASGYNTMARGPYTTAVGYKTFATGNGANAEGVYTTAGVASIVYDIAEYSVISKTITVSNTVEDIQVGDEIVIIRTSNSAIADTVTAINGVTLTVSNNTPDVTWVKVFKANTDTPLASHAEGIETIATGVAAHAEGWRSYAYGNYSSAHGESTIATGKSQFVIGKYNAPSGNNTAQLDSDYVFIIGNGTSPNSQSNALAIKWDGTVDAYGNIDMHDNDVINGIAEKLSTYKLNPDDNGIRTVIVKRRPDGTKYTESTLSGGTSPEYTTRTVVRYAADGVTVVDTKVYSLEYDVDGNLISEIFQ